MSEWNWCRGAQNNNAPVYVKPLDRGAGHTQGDLPFHVANSYVKLLEQRKIFT